jgi:hypothetical protein
VGFSKRTVDYHTFDTRPDTEFKFHRPTRRAIYTRPWTAVLNARLRRACIAGGTHVASIGPHNDLTYPVESLGKGAMANKHSTDNVSPYSTPRVLTSIFT